MLDDPLLTARADTAAARIAEGLRFATLDEAIAELRASTLDLADKDAVIAHFETLLRERAEIEFKRAAAVIASEALSIGRHTEAELFRDEIARVEYSALLDDNTCPNCRALDGKSFEMGSTSYVANSPPLRDCKGKTRCRCVYVLVLKEEAAAVK